MPLRLEPHEQTAYRMPPSMRLEIYELTLHVISDAPDKHPVCVGEIRATLDSDETAWITPCSRLVVTEEVVELLAAQLRPMGVKWMRGWHDGHWKGRVITKHGTRGVSDDVFIDEGD